MLLIILQTHCQFILSRIILRSVKCCSSFRTSPVARHVQCQEKWRRRCISLNQARQSVFARWSLNLGKIKRLQSRRTGYGSSYQVRWLIPDQRGSRIRGNLWVSSWSNETKVMLIGLIYGSSKADRHRWRSGGSTGNQLSGEEQRRPQGAVRGHAELQGTQHRARPVPKGLCVLTAPVTTKSVVPAPMFRAGVSLVVCLPRSRARRAGGAFVTNIHLLWDRAWPVCGLEPYGRMLFVNMGASGKRGIVLNPAKAVCAHRSHREAVSGNVRSWLGKPLWVMASGCAAPSQDTQRQHRSWQPFVRDGERKYIRFETAELTAVRPSHTSQSLWKHYIAACQPARPNAWRSQRPFTQLRRLRGKARSFQLRISPQQTQRGGSPPSLTASAREKRGGRPEARGGPAVPPGGSRAPAMAGSACGLGSAWWNGGDAAGELRAVAGGWRRGSL